MAWQRRGEGMSEEEFGQVVEEAMRTIPEQFHAYMENVTVEVQDRPDRRLMQRARGAHPDGLLGIYIGRPLTKRSVEDIHRLPDRIILFQRNLERICRTREELVREIRKTVLHEVGHHFGLNEDDLRRLGYG